MRPTDRRGLVAALLVVVLIATACGGDKPASPTETPTAAPSATAAASTPAISQNAPLATPTAGGLNGRLRITAQASCEQGPVGADLVVRYAVEADDAVISRVHLDVDDAEAEDSGALSQPSYVRIVTLAVDPGSRHTYKISAESPTAPSFSINGRVSCPGTPGPTT